MLNGRPAEAIASAADPAARPDGRTPMPAELGLKVARALQIRTAREVGAAVQAVQATLAAGQLSTAKAVVFLVGLGAIDAAFAAIEERYFVAQRDAEAGPSPPTFVLFGAATKSLRRDPRFSQLIQRLGFETFWRVSGVQPDFRRTGVSAALSTVF